MHNMSGLYDELHRTHLEINKQIEVEKEIYKNQQESHPHLQYYDIYQARLPSGAGILTELLAAKAQVLNGMAALKAADVTSKVSRR